MRKNIRIAAALASLAVLSSVAAPAVSAAAVPTGQKYKGLVSAYTGTSTVTTANDNYNAVTVEGLTTYNATEFKKVLEIEDTANIPAVTFTYTVEPSEQNIPATYEGNNVKTLAVYKGINPGNIVYKLENVDTGDFVKDSNAAYVAASDTSGIKKTATGFELTYKQQKVTQGTDNTVDGFIVDGSGESSSTKKAPNDDNVLINNVAKGKINTDSNVDTYYAIKTVQMDFSGCGFTEPGIYRYILTETGSNVSGMKNGQTSDTSKAAETVRTIDVYVEDATFTEGTTEQNYLRIAGYVMYVGKQTAGPDYKDPTTSSTAADPTIWQVNLEDGMTNTSSTTDYGKVNGAEIMNGTNPVQKSEGIPNFFSTNDITFGKTVKGNQGSKDKYFKFTLALTADTDGTNANIVNDNDTFAITGIWDKTVTAGTYTDGTVDAAPNAATPYTAAEISNASNTYNTTTGVVTLGTNTAYGNNVEVVTGAQLKAGYSFYLSDADHITVHGLPSGIGYTITENQDDYVPSVDAWDGNANTTSHPDRTAGTNDYDGKNGTDAVSLVITSNAGNTTANPSNTAVLTDTKVEKDVDVQFTNTRKGTIPTGVILSVAAPATIGIAVVGGIIYLVAKRKKDEDDEEE